MGFASLPVQEEKLKLWKALNRSQMQRPMVCIDQLPWNELNINNELTCFINEPYWKNIEIDLKRKIYKLFHIMSSVLLSKLDNRITK